MNIREAQEAVVSAGLKLVETGLIARTWGNVSCRIDENRFAITPSGMAYDTLRPEDIAVVNIADLSWEGPYKPSSEKGVHAEVYRIKPEAGFVIHTHQTNASVAGVLGGGVQIQDADAAKRIGDTAPLAAYGLPGTKRLYKNVAVVLPRSDSRAILMAHHGAVCFGADATEAFEIAHALERTCARFVAAPKAAVYPAPAVIASHRSGSSIALETESGWLTMDIATGKATAGSALPAEARLHREIYLKRKDVSAIIASSLPYIVDASRELRAVPPQLDDFAQIVGRNALAVDPVNASQVVRALGNDPAQPGVRAVPGDW
jgi:L-fuculose-phosphate aldolase